MVLVVSLWIKPINLKAWRSEVTQILATIDELSRNRVEFMICFISRSCNNKVICTCMLSMFLILPSYQNIRRR